MKNGYKKFGLKKSILFVFIIYCFLFGALESFLRIVDYRSESSQLFLKFHVPEIKSAGYVYDPDVFWKLKENFRGQVSKNYPWYVSINSQGMRNPEISVEKKTGTFRIIVIGDSTAFGWGVPENRTFSRRLEKKLNKNRSEKHFEVINAAVPGYTSYQGLQYLKKNLLKYAPDALLVYFGLNDFTGARFFEDKEQKMYTDKKWNLFVYALQYIKSCRLFYDLIMKIRLKHRFDNRFFSAKNFRVSPSDYVTNLMKMKGLAKSKGFNIYFITPVWNSPEGIIYNYPFWLKKRVDFFSDIEPTIDIFSALKKHENRTKKIFMDRAHPTEYGHQIIAEKISTYFIPKESSYLNSL